MVEEVPICREKVCILERVSRFSRRLSGLSLRKFYYMADANEKFYVYILQSLKDFSFYIGQCHDLDARMSKHFDGMSKYTASKRPWRLVYFETFYTRHDALMREKQIKLKKSRKYIEFLIINWKA